MNSKKTDAIIRRRGSFLGINDQILTALRKVSLSLRFPFYDEIDKTNGLIGFDIPALKKMRSKVRETEDYFRTLIKISPYGIVITDTEGFPTFVSRKAREIFRIPEQSEIKGHWVFGFVAPEDRERALGNFNASITGNGRSTKTEYRCITCDNEIIWTEVIASPITDGTGKITGLMIMCNNISVRKKAEQELIDAKQKTEQSDNFKDALIRNISHEIRTPLNAILGFTDLINDPLIPAEEKLGYVEILKACSDQLLNTIDNLVNISSIESGITSLELDDVDPNEVIKCTYHNFHKKAVNKNIRILINESCRNERITIKTDRKKLYQILSNLVNNAIKYTWVGEVIIGYEIKDCMIEFHVSDTGIGIPAEFQSDIFENFFQVEMFHGGRNGIGLGLPICKAYIGLLGGKIWLKSEPGRGSAFFFTLPL